jgi:succinoglycan biosynthesis protein ExoA
VNVDAIHHQSDHVPRVSIIVPVLNEERHIERCVTSIQSQAYPPEEIEIIAVDGGSVDNTRVILGRLADADPRVCLLANPQRSAAAGLNVGLAQARGEFILRVDAHSIIAPDYVERCVAHLMANPEIANVGGILRPIGETVTGDAIAAALQSPFSMGWSPSRYRRQPGETDTVYLGAFRRRELLAIGQYRAELEANEDYELNIRLRAAGRKIWCDPAIESQTFTRDGVAALARQYARYGYWKARVLRRHPTSALPRHLAAPICVAVLFLALAAGIGFREWAPLLALCGAYGLTTLYFAWRIGSVARRRARWLATLIFAVMHVCWGVGFWTGLLPVCLRARHTSSEKPRRPHR